MRKGVRDGLYVVGDTPRRHLETLLGLRTSLAVLLRSKRKRREEEKVGVADGDPNDFQTESKEADEGADEEEAHMILGSEAPSSFPHRSSFSSYPFKYYNGMHKRMHHNQHCQARAHHKSRAYTYTQLHQQTLVDALHAIKCVLRIYAPPPRRIPLSAEGRAFFLSMYRAEHLLRDVRREDVSLQRVFQWFLRVQGRIDEAIHSQRSSP